MTALTERLTTGATALAAMGMMAAPALAQGTGQGQGSAPGPGPGWGWGYGHPMMWGWGGGGGSWMIASGFVHLLALVGIIAVVLLIVRLFRHGPYCPYHRHGGGESLSILEGRYVRGEIGRDEYLEKKRDLTGR